MNHAERIGRLLYSNRRGELRADEETELTAWRKQSPENEELFRDSMDPEKLRKSMIELYQARDRVLKKIKERIPGLGYAEFSQEDFIQEPVEGKRVWMSPVARRAMIGLLVLSVIVVIILRVAGCMHKKVEGDPDAVFNSPEGTENFVDEIPLGFHAARAHIEARKNEIGEYDYWASSRDQNKKWRNIVSSAKKGIFSHFRLILPDSTWIWVNTSTWIKYPRNFSQDTIHISVDGETYFEGKRDSLHPYIISILPIRPLPENSTQPKPISHNKIVIEASTAHFDVNAYSDSSSMRITAITGNLSIVMDTTRDDHRSVVQLFAGQQAEIKEGKLRIIEPGDINQILSRAKWYVGK
jgi:hypothetical protein